MMKLEHPQEIEVWYVIPAIKRELSKSMMKDYGLSQKNVASLLGITEAAVSQYINSKRASEVVFNDEFKAMIKNAAQNIRDNKNVLVREIQCICKSYRDSKIICELHKKVGVVYEEDCKACLDINKG